MSWLAHLPVAVLISLGLTSVMIFGMIWIVYIHDQKHQEFDQWVDFSFSRESLRQAINYYRAMAIWMLSVYIIFVISCLWLQFEGYIIFADAHGPTRAYPIAISLFALDLVLRGGFFDFMQHFDVRLSPIVMNRGQFWFVWYAFVFRLFFGFMLIKILLSFVWIWGKIRLGRPSA